MAADATGTSRPGSTRPPATGVFRDNRQAWQDWAEVDPLYAIVTAPGTDHGRWDPEAFYASGQETIDHFWGIAQEHGLPKQAHVGLDFGCGAGRLTRALARHVDRVVGLDISEGMVRLAREHNRDIPGAIFELHEAEDLGRFGSESFDVVCCLLVLQHIPSKPVIERYIGELVRLLAPGGLLIMQVATRVTVFPPPTTWRARLGLRTRLAKALRRLGVSPRWLYDHLGWRPAMPLVEVSDERVRELVTSAGGSVVWALKRPDHIADDHIYLVTR